MNRAKIVEALRSAEADDAVRGTNRLQLMMLVHTGAVTSVSRLVGFLNQAADLEPFHEKYQIYPGGAHLVDGRFLATWLLLRARQVGIDRAIADLERYLAAEKVPFIRVIALAGVELQRTCSLGRGIQLVPWESVPASYWKERLDESAGDVFFYPFYRPTAALLRSEEVSVFHEAVPPTQLPLSLTDEDLRDALLCMTLIGPSAPLTISSWTQAAEWAPVQIAGSSQGYPGRAVRRVYDDADQQRLKVLHEKFLVLLDAEKQHYRIPLARLNSAMRRTTWVDSAIDLGIALESIFLQDLEPDRGELTFRLRVRAARFLAVDVQERRSLFQFFGDLYGVRSNAVHSGTVPANVRGRDTQEVLNRGYELVAAATESMILTGAPDWLGMLLG
jgi:hypothetical protein